MQNTKFFNRRLKPGARAGSFASSLSLASDVLQEACNAWVSLEGVRRKTRRSVMYAYEDQWGDVIRNPDFGTGLCEGDTGGRYITEARYIMNQGKVPLKNNVIRPIIKNIDGQFRQNRTRPVCVVRDPKEASLMALQISA